MKPRGLVLTIGMLASGVGWAWAQSPGPWTSAGIAACIRDPGCRASFVVAHRANGFGAPEDSRAAVRAAIEAGDPIIEIDLRRTADGQLVVLHDPCLSRTTSMKGKVKDFTAAELRCALLANGEPLPTFAEIYALSRGKAVLDLRFHEDDIEQTAEWIAGNGSFDDVIFFVISEDLAKTAARVRQRYRSMIVMPKAQNWADAEKVAALFGRPPEILHPDTIDPEFDRQCHFHGIKVFRNLMDPGTARPTMLANAGEFLDKQIDFLQTNEPTLFLGTPYRPRAPVEARAGLRPAGQVVPRSSSGTPPRSSRTP